MAPINRHPAWVCLLPLILVFVWYSSGSLAHTKLSESVPEADSVITETPEELILKYGGAVNLVKVTLTDRANKAVDMDFKPAAEPASAFKLPLPSLEAGHYTAKWTALGADGHMLEGSFSFTLESGGY